MCTFLHLCILQGVKQMVNLLLKTLLEGKRMQGQSPPEHPLIHSRITHSYEHQAPLKAPSFISLIAPCAVACSRIHLVTRSVKQTDHLVQFNREL